VRYNALTLEEALDALCHSVATRQSLVMPHINLNTVYHYHRNGAVRELLDQASLVTIDGMPMVWAARLGGYATTSAHRISHSETLCAILATATSRRWRVFFLGQKPGVVKEAVRRLRRAFPALSIGYQNGYVEDDRATIDTVSGFAPHLLFVGLGTPRQEEWILEHLPRLPACVILPTGGTLDYVAGVQPQPPQCLGPIGMSWAYRFVLSPRRLFRRYWIEPIALLPYLHRDVRAWLGRKLR
jgi:N-acetylglucosaminyldiphosphoundecaprenol N-acetyl-beta-D-mannosaminyltransferase